MDNNQLIAELTNELELSTGEALDKWAELLGILKRAPTETDRSYRKAIVNTLCRRLRYSPGKPDPMTILFDTGLSADCRTRGIDPERCLPELTRLMESNTPVRAVEILFNQLHNHGYPGRFQLPKCANCFAEYDDSGKACKCGIHDGGAAERKRQARTAGKRIPGLAIDDPRHSEIDEQTGLTNVGRYALVDVAKLHGGAVYAEAVLHPSRYITKPCGCPWQSGCLSGLHIIKCPGVALMCGWCGRRSYSYPISRDDAVDRAIGSWNHGVRLKPPKQKLDELTKLS